MRAFNFRDLVRHGLIYGIGGIAQSALGFILLPILTTRMSASEFGVYSLVLMAATIAGAIFYLGMTSAMPRSYFDSNEEIKQKSIFTTAFLILLIGAIGQILIGCYFGSFIARLILQSSGDQYVLAIKWAFFGSALTFVNQYFFSYLRLKRYSIASVFLSIGGLFSGVLLTIYFLNIDSEILVSPFKAIAYSQILIVSIILLLYGREMFIWRIAFEECKPLIHFGLATVLTSFGLMVLDWADRIIIERYMSFADVGLYSAAIRVSGLMGVLLITPFTQIWSPMMFEYQKNKNIKEITSKVLSYFLILGGILLALISPFSVEILHFLIKYEITQTLIFTFLTLALASLINGAANIVVAGIFYGRKIYFMPLIYSSIAIIKIVLNIFLIPIFGIGAAAFSALITSILIPCTIYYFSKRFFSFKIEWNTLLRLLFIVLIIMTLSIFNQLHDRSFENFLAQILLSFIIIIAIYVFCLSSVEKKYLENVFIRVKSAFITGN